MAVEKKEIVVEIGINTDKGVKNVKTAQQELRQLQRQLASGELTGEAFDKASKRAGELRDRIGDVNARINVLASDTPRLDVMTQAAQGLAGGFSAVQGVVGLTAGANEDLQKSILKVQSAMAILNGVQGVANVLNKDSALRIKATAIAQKQWNIFIGQGTTAMKLLNGALVATGIGFLLSALSLLIKHFSDIKAKVLELVPQLGIIGQAFDKLKGIIDNFLGTKEGREREALQKTVDNLEREIELRKKAGQNTVKLEEDLFKKRFKLAKDAEERAKIQHEFTLFLIEQQNKAKEEEAKKEAERLAKEKAIAEERRKLFEKRVEDIKNEKSKLDELTAEFEAERQALKESLPDPLQVQKDNMLASLELQKTQFDAEAQFAENDLARKKKTDEETIATEKAKRDAMIALANDSFAVLANLAQLTTNNSVKQAKIQKALALANIATNSAVAISAMVAGVQNATKTIPEPITRSIAVAGLTAQGLATITANIVNAKKILQGSNVSVSSSGFSSGQSSSTGSQPRQSQSQTLQPLQVPTITTPVKAYITQGELSNAMQVNKQIEQLSEIRRNK